MKFAEKEFKDYWKIIKISTYILIAWSLAALIVSKISFSLYLTIFSAPANWALTIVAFAFIGWTAIKDYKGTIKIAAWAGALAGIIVGFAGALIGILTFYLVPELVEYAITQAAAQGVPADTIRGFMSISIYVGLVTGPLITSLIGAALSSIAALIAKKV